MSSTQWTPPGWYPDPSNPTALRWWTGTNWDAPLAATPSPEPVGVLVGAGVAAAPVGTVQTQPGFRFPTAVPVSEVAPPPRVGIPVAEPSDRGFAPFYSSPEPATVERGPVDPALAVLLTAPDPWFDPAPGPRGATHLGEPPRMSLLARLHRLFSAES